MSEPRILIAAGCSHATVTRYRCRHLQEQFAANGIAATVEEWYDGAPPAPQSPSEPRTSVSDLADVLILQRVPMTVALGELIDAMHAAGRPVIFDVDDLVFEPQLTAWHRGVQNLPVAEQTLYDAGVRRYLGTLTRCDRVVTASPLLAELAQRHGPPAFVHRNALGHAMMALAGELYALRNMRPPSDRVVLGYGSGTPTHDVDFAEAAPALLHVLARYPQTELWIAGPMQLPVAFAGFGARVRRFPLLDWRGWFELASQMDIALAPLEMDNIFCRAKSEIKFVEAGALGLPTVASHIDPFAGAIVQGENGLLAGNPAAWMAAVERLVEDADQRRRLGEAARQTVADRYSPSARAADLARLVPELLAAREAGIHGQAGRAGRTALPMVTELPTNAVAAGAVAPDAIVPLTINWLVTEPFPGSGGHTGIFRMIRHLVDFGHVCHIHLIPVNFMQKYTPAQIQEYVDHNFMPTGAVFHQWDGQTGPADATVATYWKTVPLLLQLPMPGRRYYLVQDFEPYFYPVGSESIQAENTYRQGLHCITLGPWLAQLMREHYGADADHFDFAVDPEVYTPVPVARAGHPRVAFYARPSTPRRAYELGIKALMLLKRSQPAVEVVFYGADRLAPPPPFPVTNMGILNPWELAKLFSSCDIGLVFSTTNPSFVPFEMMACRCAVVDIRSERVAGLLEDGVNCRLADPTPQAIADTVLDFLWDRSKRAAVVERAYAQVKTMSWRHSARQIEAVLLRHAPADVDRVAYAQAGGDDADMIVWQIHQLLDAGDGTAALVDDLRSALYRTLAEKAALAQHVQEIERSYDATQQAPAWRRRVQPLANKVIGGAPVWLLGTTPLSKLTVDPTPYRQIFRADRSHLCRIELCFTAQHALHTGTIRLALYDGDGAGRLVAAQVLRVAELKLDVACAIDFPVEVDSFGKIYTLVVAAGEIHQQSPALWRFWQVQHADAALEHGEQALTGQLAFQPLFRERATLQPPRRGPAAWGAPIRLAPSFARDVAAQRSREVARLVTLARAAVRAQGIGGLAREVINYVEWQLNKGGGSS